MAFIDVKTNDVWEAQELGGHRFGVETMPLYLPNGKVVPDKVATVTNDGRYLGTVGRGYTVIQPARFYEMCQAFALQTGATVDKVITLRNGAVMGVSFDLGSCEFVSGDEVKMHFIVLTSFDGSISILGRAISNRLFCMNQLPSSTKLFDIKHTRWAEQRLDVAQKMVGYFGQEQAGFKEKMKALAGYYLPEPEAVGWFRSLFPQPRKDSKRSNSYLDNNTESFLHLLSHGKGTEISGVRGTAYGALNALTEWCNHHRATRITGDRDPEEVRWESVNLNGSNDRLMQAGFTSLVELTKQSNGIYA